MDLYSDKKCSTMFKFYELRPNFDHLYLPQVLRTCYIKYIIQHNSHKPLPGIIKRHEKIVSGFYS